MSILAGTNRYKTTHSGTGTHRLVFPILIEFLVLLVLLIAVVLAINIDVVILENNLSEVSVTEILQSVFILVSAMIFAWRAWRHIRSRGYFIAVATLFACMFVRENDALLDHIRHGFWIVPVGMIACFGIISVCRYRDSLAGPLARHFQERHTTFIFIGLLLLLVFSRLFGTGSLWQAVMGAGYDPSVKTVVQEGLELLGYALITYGTVLSFANRETAPDTHR
ncbi:hypothetical protein E2K80_14455 [Rhodophyticola sp. CCM32]|uniref:hypothetical protein n=1 Tax=Rhodophyticola sp. CCM32 TaxID=2916397 RepID=UPI00107FCAA1|nr:hypothetical protein [Rhodophyticola sp. CCM32]QBY01776.1 hypothetical protein E2K80_14455 [Rhodophyticola sp. CCM32]